VQPYLPILANMTGRRLVLCVGGLLAALVAVGSAAHGVYRLSYSFGLDQGAPVPPGELWISVAGIAATIAATAAWAVLIGYSNETAVSVALVGLALCTMPLWRRDSTLELTSDGFRQATYTYTTRDVRVYNGTDATVAICLGTAGVCWADAGDAHRLRAPGLTIAPGSFAWIGWPSGATGTYPLTVATPPSTMNRPSTQLHVLAVPKSDPGTNPDPFPPDFPQPPPNYPPPFQPPLR
jgi:hypothetical protein